MLIVVVDTLRSDHLGYAGYARDTSPNIDALAAEGQVFDKAYAASSWTLTSMASLLTAQWPWEHRVVRDPLMGERYGVLPGRVRTLAEDYASQGHRTGAFVNNTFLGPEFGLDQGFQHYSYRSTNDAQVRFAMETVDEALAWVDEAPEAPFFALLHVYEPHYNYRPVEPCAGRWVSAYEPSFALPVEHAQVDRWLQNVPARTGPDRDALIALYDEEICSADRALGVLFDGLRERDLWDDTVVVFTSDHGEEFWDHGQFGHGQHLLSVLTQVPLIVKVPGGTVGTNPTRVGHVEVAAALRDREGAVWDWMKSGTRVAGRPAFSSAPNRAMQATSVIDDVERTVLFTESVAGMVYEVDERDWEGEVTAALSRDDVTTSRGYGLLKGVHDDPLESVLPTLFSRVDVTDEQFEQLRAMGYID